MVININQAYCGDHFTIYTNIKSLCCTPETNIMQYVNYISILKKIGREAERGLKEKSK